MGWPDAFILAVIVIATFGYLAYDQRLRAKIMIEALKNGYDKVVIK